MLGNVDVLPVDHLQGGAALWVVDQAVRFQIGVEPQGRLEVNARFDGAVRTG